MTLLDDQAVAEWLGGSIWDGDTEEISATFEFDDFVGSMGFVTAVALVAEKAGHHPDIDIRWNQVSLTLSTHSEGGVTQRDLDLADEISQFA